MPDIEIRMFSRWPLGEDTQKAFSCTRDWPTGSTISTLRSDYELHGNRLFRLHPEIIILPISLANRKETQVPILDLSNPNTTSGRWSETHVDGRAAV